VSVSDANCTGTGSGLGSVTEQSAPFGSNVTVTTDPTNTFVTVCFTIVGGDAATYSVTGMAGTLTGNQFCSDPISCDQGVYQFFIQDGFACGIDEVTGPIVCNCVSGSGIMTQVEQEVCEFETVSATPATAAQFDGNDTIMYVLHTGSGPALGTIIASGATPSFAYNATTMDCGVTYYISSVVGDDDGAGQVDLTDDCLSVAEGTPVVFNCLPTASISGGGPICAGGTINGTISLTGGGPYTVVVNDGVQDITLPDIASGYAWSLSPGQTTTYALVSVTSNTTGCTNTASGSITVTVNSPVFAGTAQPAAALCAGQGQVFSLADLLTGEDAGGVWTETSAAPSAGGAFNAGAGTFNTAGQAPGTYTFRYFMDALPPCIDDNETVTVIVHPLPVADAGAQQQLTCNVSTVTIGGPGSTTGTNITYAWTFAGSPAVIGTDAAITATQAGTYELTVTNTQTGCEAKDQVVVTQDISAPVATLSTQDISCFGASDGFIFVETVTGGKPPYMFSINGGPYSSQQQFSGLGGGDYLISIEDANGCETQQVATIVEPQELVAELLTNLELDNENNYFLELGEEAVITLVSSFPAGDLDTIIWTPAELVSCNDVFCQSVTVAPSEGTIFAVTIERGPCSATSQLRILVRKPRPVYIPNMFSPNFDGQNDIFQVYGGRQVQQIRSFMVFNRWGETMFQASNFQPDGVGLGVGWDGTHRGKPMDPGIYTYFVEVEYIDGFVEILKGTVSLIR
jgi:gliding motility-associated-like protein